MNVDTYVMPPDPIYDPAVLVAQVVDLPQMAREIVVPLTSAVAGFLRDTTRSYSRVLVVGDGDSYIAGHAVELAFRRIAGMSFEAVSAQKFLDYTVDWIHQSDAVSTLVVGVSASGSTERVSQALSRARDRGLSTLALAGKPGLVSDAAEQVILIELPEGLRSPGVRTFHGSCLTLYLLAIEFGERAGRHDRAASQALRAELLSASEATSEALSLVRDHLPSLAEWVSRSPVIAMLGSGPSFGTALYAAAKILEASGVMAVAQDLEEWHHVERFAYPLDMPVFVISPAGRTSRRATELAGESVQLGRRTVLLAPAAAELPNASPLLHLPAPAGIREEFTPLVFHVALTALAAALAVRLGRSPFQADVLTRGEDAVR